MMSDQYIWRTARDGKVRPEHAAREGKIFSWSNPPAGGHPGEDYNCRCWAEPVRFRLQGLKQELTTNVWDVTPAWDHDEFVGHYYFGGGRGKTLSEIGHFRAAITHAASVMGWKVTDQVAEQMRKIKSGRLIYETSNSYDFKPVHFWFGRSTVRTRTVGTVKENDPFLSIFGTVFYFSKMK